jgi:hypothetical protein
MKLNNSRTVDFNGLTQISTPAPTATWQPMPHNEVMTTVIEQAEKRDLHIDELKYQIVDVVENKVRQPHPDMFATMYMESENGVYRNMLGIRNSHNKRFGASACSGGQVLVCSNGYFTGDHIISSKHTKHVHTNFNNRVSNMLDQVVQTWSNNETRFNKYMETELSMNNFYQILGDAIINGALPQSKAEKVHTEYLDPRHDAFADRNAWSAFNAFTEIHKECRTSIANSAQRGIALHKVFDRFCNVQLTNPADTIQSQLQLN